MNRSPPPEIPGIDSPVFRRAAGSSVGRRESPWGLALGLAVCIVLGVIVFGMLSAGRQARADASRQPVVRRPVAAVAMRPEPAAAVFTPSPGAVRPAPLTATLPPPGNDPARRLHAPVMVVDLSDAGPAATAAVPAQGSSASQSEGPVAGSAEERFAARVASGGVETSRATRLRDLTRTAPQGTIIPAVLETAINSDLPGSVRAVVSQDVRGFDGAQVLIPRGSKLIGQYRSGVALGQSRAFVVWSRILTPEGVSVEIGSPATDPLGRGGLAGETDTHFFQRFGGAILLSVLSAGMEAVSRNGPNTAIIIGSPDQAARLAGLVPQNREIQVTVKVMQGSPLQVFLVRDLDFSGVQPRR